MNQTEITQDKQYRVVLKTVVELFGKRIYPGTDLTVRGDVLLTIFKHVKSYVEAI